MKLTNLITKISNERAHAQKTLDAWQDQFAKNPIFAMQWSDDTFNAAADLENVIRISDIVDYGQSKSFSDEAIINEVVKFVRREVIRMGTQNTNRSTSQGSNMMDYARVEGMIKWMEWLDD